MYTTDVTVSNVEPSISLTGHEPPTRATEDLLLHRHGSRHRRHPHRHHRLRQSLRFGRYDPATGQGSFQCEFPDGPGTTDVTATVTDSDVLRHGRPEMTVDTPTSPRRRALGRRDAADEGQTKSYTYTVNDLGDDANPTITTSCGTGVTKSNETSSGFDCTFPDGPANPTVSVSADDGDPSNNTGSDTRPVDVSNLPPTADGQSVNTDEDTTKTITLTGSDPAGGADPLSFKITSLPDDGTLYEGNGTSAADEIQPSDLPRTLAGDQATYEPDANYNGPNSFEFKANDGTVNSAAATVSVSVAAINDAPTVETESGSASYTEGGDAAEISPLLTVDDPDTANLTGATVSITTGRLSGDTLSFDTQNGITGNYDSGTGVLTLSGPSSVENYQTALRSVRYSSTSNSPGTSRTVSFQVNDGEAANNLSNTATRNISITEVNSAPEITTSTGTTSFTENDPAIEVDNALTVTDSDSSDLVGATVEITSGYAGGEDELLFTDQNGITGSVSVAAHPDPDRRRKRGQLPDGATKR